MSTNDMRPERQPTAEDWAAIGNDMRVVMNGFHAVLGIPPLPSYEGPKRLPTEDELAAWDAMFPGSADRFRS